MGEKCFKTSIKLIRKFHQRTGICSIFQLKFRFLLNFPRIHQKYLLRKATQFFPIKRNFLNFTKLDEKFNFKTKKEKRVNEKKILLSEKFNK